MPRRARIESGPVSRDTTRLTAFSDGVFAISRRFRLALVWLATGALLGALLPAAGVAVIVAFNAFYWLPCAGRVAAVWSSSEW